MPELRLLFPSPERPRAWGAIASVALHAAMLTVIVVTARQQVTERTKPTVIQLIALEQAPKEREFALPAPTAQEPVAVPVTVPQPQVRALSPVDTVPIGVVVAPREVPIGVPTLADNAMVIGRNRVIGPSFALGRVWVRPLEAELGVVGPSPSVAAHVARVDSALRERILAYIDSMPRDSFAAPACP